MLWLEFPFISESQNLEWTILPPKNNSDAISLMQHCSTEYITE